MNFDIRYLRYRVRGRTAAEWAAINEVLLDRELGLETDTRKFKFGDGSTAWNALAYAGGGDAGGTPEMRVADGYIQFRPSESEQWLDLIALSDLAGPPGASAEFRATATHLQWRLVGSGAWINLVPLSALAGPSGFYTGPTAPAGDRLWLDTAANELKWYDGTAWQTLVVGKEGPPGPKGASSGQFLFGAGDRVRTLPPGTKALVPVTFAGEIRSARMVLVTIDGAPGTLQVDLRRCSFDDYTFGRPSAADSVTGGKPISIVNGFKIADDELLAWEKTFGTDDVFVAVVVSRSVNVAHFALVLRTEKDE